MFVRQALSALAFGLITVSYAAPTPTAAATSTCTATPTQLFADHSFEKGAGPWSFTGGAVVGQNGDGNTWGFSTTKGTHFGLLTSNSTVLTSTIAQSVGAIPLDTLTLSFDWQFLVSVVGDGPPRFPCTLAVTVGINTPTSWTYDASQGGNGHVKTTFPYLGGGDTITFTFSCPAIFGGNYAGAVIDNLKLTPC